MRGPNGVPRSHENLSSFHLPVFDEDRKVFTLRDRVDAGWRPYADQVARSRWAISAHLKLGSARVNRVEAPPCVPPKLRLVPCSYFILPLADLTRFGSFVFALFPVRACRSGLRNCPV